MAKKLRIILSIAASFFLQDCFFENKLIASDSQQLMIQDVRAVITIRQSYLELANNKLGDLSLNFTDLDTDFGLDEVRGCLEKISSLSPNDLSAVCGEVIDAVKRDRVLLDSVLSNFSFFSLKQKQALVPLWDNMVEIAAQDANLPVLDALFSSMKDGWGEREYLSRYDIHSSKELNTAPLVRKYVSEHFFYSKLLHHYGVFANQDYPDFWIIGAIGNAGYKKLMQSIVQDRYTKISNLIHENQLRYDQLNFICKLEMFRAIMNTPRSVFRYDLLKSGWVQGVFDKETIKKEIKILSKDRNLPLSQKYKMIKKAIGSIETLDDGEIVEMLVNACDCECVDEMTKRNYGVCIEEVIKQINSYKGYEELKKKALDYQSLVNVKKVIPSKLFVGTRTSF